MSDKPAIDRVTLVPDQPLTENEKQECTAFLHSYQPKIIWEVGQKVIAYPSNKTVNLYIRSTEPRTVFTGYLAEDGEINIVEHQMIGEHAASTTAFTGPRIGVAVEPVLVVNRVPPGVEIQIKIKTTKMREEI